jgi:hypothetical protein
MNQAREVSPLRDGLLLLLLAGEVVSLTGAQQYWWLGAAISALAAVLVLWFNLGQHKLRAYRMKRPFYAALTLAPEQGHVSWATELHVPPHTEVALQLRLSHRLHYRQLELIFGFEGDAGRRPQPLSVLNTFVKVGQTRTQSPADTPTHYIDYNDAYHIREQADRTRPNVSAFGFIVKTRAPGRYPVRLQMITDGGESFPVEHLTLTVETR